MNRIKRIPLKGEFVELPYISLDIADQIAASITSDRENEAEKLAKELKLTPYEIFNLKLQNRYAKANINDVRDFLATTSGARRALDIVFKSISLPQETITKIYEYYSPVEIVALAINLLVNSGDDREELEKVVAIESPLPPAPSGGAGSSQEKLLQKARGYGSHKKNESP